MKIVFILLASMLLMPLHVFAQKMIDIENSKNYMQASMVDGSTLLEVCTESNGCEVFPHEQAGLAGFEGSEKQWSEFFHHCSNYSHINGLALGAEILSGFVAIGWLSANQLLIKGSKVVTGMAVGMGNYGLRGQGTRPYPSVSKADVDLLDRYKKSFIRQDEVQSYIESSEMFKLLHQTLKDCSLDFNRVFQVREYVKKQRKFVESKKTHCSNSSAGENLKIFERENDKKYIEDLQNYLNSLK